MGHDVFGLVVEHQVDSRKGCITKECCRQAAEKSPVPFSAIDALQGCIDALIAVPPALQRKHRTSGWRGGPRFEQGTHLTSGYVAFTRALVPVWLAFSDHNGLDFRF